MKTTNKLLMVCALGLAGWQGSASAACTFSTSGGGSAVVNATGTAPDTNASCAAALGAASAAGSGFNLTTATAPATTGTAGVATGTTPTAVVPTSTLTLTAGDNMVIDKTFATPNNTVQFSVSPTPKFTSVTTGALTATGQTTLANTNITGTTNVSGALNVTAGTAVNMGGNVITNVAAGVAGTDAVNVDQLKQIAVLTGTGHKVTTSSTGTGTVSGKTLTPILPGDTVTYTAGNNMAITQNGAEVQLAVSPTPTFVKTTTTDLTVTGTTNISGALNVTAGTAVNMGGNVITNVAAGVAPTDAVNVSQLTNSSASTLSAANTYSDKATAVAMAVAGLPQATKPGASMVALAIGGYRGGSAVALGWSGQSQNSKWLYKAGVSTNNGSHVGANLAVGYQWGGD